MTSQDKPAKTVTLGSIAMQLRQAAGITRRVIGKETGLGAALYKSFECGKHLLSVEQRQKVLRHPVFRDLHNMACSAGLEPPT